MCDYVTDCVIVALKKFSLKLKIKEMKIKKGPAALLLHAILTAAVLSAVANGASRIISTTSDFIKFIDNVNNDDDFKGTTVELMNDLDFDGLAVKPVGIYYSKVFSGTFNGNGHLIKNFKYQGADDIQFVGLFGYVDEGTVSGLVLDSSCEIKSKYEYRLNLGYGGAAVGGLIGYCDSCYVKDCASFASVSHTGKVSFSYTFRIGGFMGHCHENGAVKNSASGGSVSFQGSGSGDIFVGGFFGITQKAKIENIVTTAEVSSTKSGVKIGTICGKYSDRGTIKNAAYLNRNGLSPKGDGKGDFGSLLDLENGDFSTISGGKESALNFLNAHSTANSLTQWGAFICNLQDKAEDTKVLSYFSWVGYSPKKPSVVGYSFIDWYSDEGLTTPYVGGVNNRPKIFGANTMIYAKFIPINYTITFHDDHGDPIEDMIVPFNGHVTIPTPTCNNRSLVFAGWKEDGKTFSMEKMPARNISLTAVWVVHIFKEYFNITFDTGDGGSYVNPLRLEVGSAINLSLIPTKEGHTFEYWHEDGLPQFDEKTMPNRNIMLHAKWTPNNYSITAYGEGNQELYKIEARYNESINIPTPTNPDETLVFDGWFEGDSLFDLERMPARNVSLTAKWETGGVIKYFVFFNTGEGGSHVGPRKFELNENIVLPEPPTKEGYSFDYWREGDSTRFTEKPMPNRNITLHAEWVLNNYTITIYKESDQEVDTIVIGYNEPIVLTEPTNSNITLIFDGWLEGEFVFELERMPARNVSLTAKWEYIPATLRQFYVRFDTDEGSFVNPIMRHIDEPIDITEKSTKVGYTFVCWMGDNGDCFNETNMPAKDLILKAGWKINNYTITFITDNPGEIEPINAEFNSPFELRSTTREGHDFRYWYEDNALTSFDLRRMLAENVTLRPFFVSKEYTITFTEVEGSDEEKHMRTYTYNESLYTPIPKRTGYIFSRWLEKSSSGESKKSPFTLTEMPAHNLDLLAEWKPSKNVLVYDTGDDDVDDEDFVAKDVDSTIDSLYIPQRKGKTFCGWYTDETFKTPFNETGFDFSSGDLIFAKWC